MTAPAARPGTVRPGAARPRTARLGPGRRLAAYAALARVQARTQRVYRTDFLFGAIGLLLQIYLLRLVWTAVYPDSGSAAGAGREIPLDTQLAYVSLASVQAWLANSDARSLATVQLRIREGAVALDLVRPVRFTAQLIAARAGATLAMLPFAGCALVFSVLAGGSQAPASAPALLVYAASLVPAYTCALLLGVIVGLISFWTLELDGFYSVYLMTAHFFSGALVPLWFMPDWLADLARLLPFQAMVHVPTALYLGRIGGTGAVLQALAVQCGWAVALWLLLRLVWARALRRVVVQGG
ncbi:ABC transporter permease [Kitasatospora sp. NPDC057692]|uniref:ABC transporter permease n=1 Tax=Kitasatospora sp. NPDC057692 TaxID=3346215 RepID=UPI0036A240BD